MRAAQRTRRLRFTFISAELDVGEQTDLDDLPEQPQHQVRFPRLQVQRADVYNMAADGRGRVQGQVQILLGGAEHGLMRSSSQPRRTWTNGTHLDGKRCQLLLVDRTLVNGVRHRQVDHFAAMSR